MRKTWFSMVTCGALIVGAGLDAGVADAATSAKPAVIATCHTLAPAIGNFGRGYVYSTVQQYSVGDLLLDAGSVFAVEDNVKTGEKITAPKLTTQYLTLIRAITAQVDVAVKQEIPGQELIGHTYRVWAKLYKECAGIDGQYPHGKPPKS